MRTCRQIPYSDERVAKLNKDLSFQERRYLDYEISGNHAIIANSNSQFAGNQVDSKQRYSNQGTTYKSVSGTMPASSSGTTTSKTQTNTQSGSLSAKYK
jgi:hypothetical protein